METSERFCSRIPASSRSSAATRSASRLRSRRAAPNLSIAGSGAAANVVERKFLALATTASAHLSSKYGANLGSEPGRLTYGTANHLCHSWSPPAATSRSPSASKSSAILSFRRALTAVTTNRRAMEVSSSAVAGAKEASRRLKYRSRSKPSVRDRPTASRRGTCFPKMSSATRSALSNARPSPRSASNAASAPEHPRYSRYSRTSVST